MNAIIETPSKDALCIEKELRDSIGTILEITLEPITFQRQLVKILDVIVSLSWMGAMKKGAILVTNDNEELVMAAHHNLEETLITRCAKVAFGHCLCGKAAVKKEILFKPNVDSDHDVTYDNMDDHGHYNIPIFGNNKVVVGMLVLYLEVNHQPQKNEQEFLSILASILSTTILNRDLQLKAEVNNIRLTKAQIDITEKLVSASEFRDTDTGEHIKRMSLYSVVFAQEYGLDSDQVELLKRAAPLHDIGKVGISDTILLKQGRLTEDEFKTVETHTTIGGNILVGDHELIKAGRHIALTHHERWDGKGYPNGISGKNIPLFGRICALADVFDALTTKRPYKDPWPLEKTLDMIREGNGTQFDPEVVDAFFKGLPKILEIQSRYMGTIGNKGEAPVLGNGDQMEGIVSWDEKLSVGVTEIDNQHKYLISLINRLHLAIASFNIKDTVEALLEMKSYSVIHFADEEKVMEEMGYPELEIHKKIHQSFVDKAEQFAEELGKSPMATSLDMVLYLKDWTVNHILAVDSGYSQFLVETQENR